MWRITAPTSEGGLGFRKDIFEVYPTDEQIEEDE
jgi:hypothetical protein